MDSRRDSACIERRLDLWWRSSPMRPRLELVAANVRPKDKGRKSQSSAPARGSGHGGGLLTVFRYQPHGRIKFFGIRKESGRVHDECVVGVYNSLAKAEQAVHDLRRIDCPASQISVVMSQGGDVASIEHLRLADDSEARAAALDAGLGGLLGYLGGVVVALVFGVGTVFLVGPIGGLYAGATMGLLLCSLEH